MNGIYFLANDNVSVSVGRQGDKREWTAGMR